MEKKEEKQWFDAIYKSRYTKTTYTLKVTPTGRGLAWYGETGIYYFSSEITLIL